MSAAVAQAGAVVAPMLHDGPADGPLLVLAHGAGAPMDSPFMATLAAGLAAQGVHVVRFEFPYMHERRRSGSRRAPDRTPVLQQSWLAVLAALAGGGGAGAGDPGAGAANGPAGGAAPPFIGGKSLGGRIASQIADRAGVRGLVCLGYPFSPPGRAPGAPPGPGRVDHLRDLHTPTLILQGTRDPFGGPAEVAALTLSPAIRLHWIEDGDHSFKPRRASGRSESGNLAEAVTEAAAFVRGGGAQPPAPAAESGGAGSGARR